MERGLASSKLETADEADCIEVSQDPEIWEITSLRELELARIDEGVIDVGFAIAYLEEPAEYRLALLGAFLHGRSMILDDGKEVTVSWYEKEVLLSTPLMHAYAHHIIQDNQYDHLRELFPNENSSVMDEWLVRNMAETSRTEDPAFWQSAAFLLSEARVAIHNLVIADYARRLLTSELAEE